MCRVEMIEGQIKELTRTELTAFREWFAQFDAEEWDKQFEADVKAGRLDAWPSAPCGTTLRVGRRNFDSGCCPYRSGNSRTERFNC